MCFYWEIALGLKKKDAEIGLRNFSLLTFLLTDAYQILLWNVLVTLSVPCLLFLPVLSSQRRTANGRKNLAHSPPSYNTPTHGQNGMSSFLSPLEDCHWQPAVNSPPRGHAWNCCYWIRQFRWKTYHMEDSFGNTGSYCLPPTPQVMFPSSGPRAFFIKCPKLQVAW